MSNKVLVIAEIGMNHEGSIGQAEALVKAAKDCGVDAVKFQMHISKEETIRNAPSPTYFKNESRYEYFNRTAFSMEEWKILKNLCKELGLMFVISPFSIEAVKRIAEIGVDYIKIPSGEVTNIPYLRYISQTKIPAILSSGMSTLKELDEAVEILKEADLTIMQCTSEYPCRPESTGFNLIKELAERYKEIPIGFSDHSDNIWTSIAAVCYGASMVERHFTLSRKMYGPDAYMSLEPDAMEELVHAVDFIKKAVDSPIDKNDIGKFSDMRYTFQKSIVSLKDLKAGDVITEDNIAIKKPGNGIQPKRYEEVMGKRVKKDISEDCVIMEGDIEW